MAEDFNYGHFFNLSDGNFTLNKQEDRLRLTIDGSHPLMLFFGKDGKLETHVDARFKDGKMRRGRADLLKDLNPAETRAFVDNQYKKPPLNKYEQKMEGGGSITFTEFKDGYKQIELFSKESEMGKGKSFHSVYLFNKDGKLIYAFENGKVLENTNANSAGRGGNDDVPPEPPRDFIDDDPDIPPVAGGQIDPDGPPPPAGITIGPEGPPPPPAGVAIGPDGPPPPNGEVGIGPDNPPPPNGGNDNDKWPKLTEEKMPDGSSLSTYLYEDNTYATYYRGSDGSYFAEYLTQDGRIVTEKQTDKNSKLVRDEHSIFSEMTEDKAKGLVDSEHPIVQAKARLFLKLLAEKNEQKAQETLNVTVQQIPQEQVKEETPSVEQAEPKQPTMPPTEIINPVKRTFSGMLKGMWATLKSALKESKASTGLKDIAAKLSSDLNQIKAQSVYAAPKKVQNKTISRTRAKEKTQAKIPVSKMMGMGR